MIFMRVTSSIPEDLTTVQKLFIEGYPDRALELVSELEKRVDLKYEERIECYLLKAELLLYFSNLKDAFYYSEKANQMSFH